MLAWPASGDAMTRHTQYSKPRCPKCKRNTRVVLGYDLIEVKRTEERVLVYCNFCHHLWWSTNAAALGGVLRKQGVI